MAREEYFATGYTREELTAMHPTIDLGPEWAKLPNWLELFDKESGIIRGPTGWAIRND
jgi:hypothetical protein